MKHINHIELCTLILKYIEKKGFLNVFQIEIQFCLDDLKVDIGTIKSIVKFLVSKEFLDSSMKNKKTVMYSINYQNRFDYQNYLSIIDYAKVKSYCSSSVSRRIKNKVIVDFVKISRKYYINPNY